MIISILAHLGHAEGQGIWLIMTRACDQQLGCLGRVCELHVPTSELTPLSTTVSCLTKEPKPNYQHRGEHLALGANGFFSSVHPNATFVSLLVGCVFRSQDLYNVRLEEKLNYYSPSQRPLATFEFPKASRFCSGSKPQLHVHSRWRFSRW